MGIKTNFVFQLGPIQIMCVCPFCFGRSIVRQAFFGMGWLPVLPFFHFWVSIWGDKNFVSRPWRAQNRERLSPHTYHFQKGLFLQHFCFKKCENKKLIRKAYRKKK